MNIYLTGYRCSGKTSTGKKLSSLMNMGFLDTDEIITKKIGMSIKSLVSEKGWEAFRKIEKKIMTETALLDLHVISTGGGVVLDPENIKIMKKAGKVIWLKTSLETALKRIACDPLTPDQRPPLCSEIDSDERALFDARLVIYEKSCDVAVDAENLEIEEICRKILESLGEE